MTDLFKLILGILASRFKARATLEAENLVLRQQVNVLRRRTPKRLHLRIVFYLFGSIAGFRPSLRWLRSSGRRLSFGGTVGELLKLGFEVAQSTVARYMCRHLRPPSQGWPTFLNNHVDGIAAIDLFVLPTIAFQILYCLVIVRHGRRLWVSFGVTANPTAEWISRQVTEAFPWDHAPRYLIRIETSRMVQSSCSGSVQWAFGTIRSHPDRPGKMLTLSDSSARSAVNVSTT
jgi:hypothetical protein